MQFMICLLTKKQVGLICLEALLRVLGSTPAARTEEKGIMGRFFAGKKTICLFKAKDKEILFYLGELFVL